MCKWFSRSIGVFKSPLTRRVALLVLISVVAIEFGVLVLTAFQRHHELLQDHVAQVERAFVSPVKQQRHQPQRSVTPLTNQLELYPEVVGVVLYQADGQPVMTLGETLQLQPPPQNSIRLGHYVARDRYEVAWLIPHPQGNLMLGLRLDTRTVQAQLIAELLRMLGLIGVLALVVTVTSMAVIHGLVAQPIARLRNDLLRVADMINVEDYEFHFDVQPRRRSDELGALFRAFENLYGRIQHEIRAFRQTEADFAIEACMTQQAQAHSAELQQVLRELRGTQAQLIHSEKMSSLGQLVAGIAHEFNNPVNFINGNIMPLQHYTHSLLALLGEYQQTYPDVPEPLQVMSASIDLDYIRSDLPKILTSIETGTQRIATIVESLRSFSQLDETGMKQVDIHDGLESSLMLLQHRVTGRSQGLQVVKDYGDLPLVECFANQLNQVFISLLRNAIDAIDQQEHFGLIRIRTRQLKSGWIQIVITDNGSGISAEALPRVFDPFFTTKPVGQGTGLGLSVSYQIIQMHSGKLHCRSSEEDGTTFTIEVPVCQSAACQPDIDGASIDMATPDAKALGCPN